MNEELLQRLDVLAAKLGITSQYLWGVLMAQARVAVVECLFEVMCGIVLCLVSRHFYKSAIGLHRWEESDLSLAMALVIGVLGVVILLIGGTLIWAPLLNPEYYALSIVLEAIEGAVK